MNKMIKNAGYTLIELLIATAITSVAAIGAVSHYKDLALEEQENSAVKTSENLVSSYKKFYIVNNRAPNNIAELLASDFSAGANSTPWGSAIGGAPSVGGNAFSFNYSAQSVAQAQNIASRLGKYNAIAAGSVVSFQTPVPTVKTVADQMLCRRDIPGEPGCNVMEVNLEVNNNDLLGINRVEANTVEFAEFTADSGIVDNLTVNQSITLGGTSITHNGSQLEFNANNSVFSGNVEVIGNIVGNNSNISGINTLSANNVTGNQGTFAQGVITDLQGNSLDYNTGDFGTVNANYTYSNTASFGNLTTTNLTAQNVDTDNFEGIQGYFENAYARVASGVNLSLTGRLTTNNLSSSVSNLGATTGSTANYSGQVRGGSFVGGSASFSSVAVSGNVSGANFYGNDFCAGSACVNSNKTAITSNASSIASNSTKISSNTSSIASNTTKISSNTSNIASNTTKISSNTSNIASNTSNIASNTSLVNSNSSRINTNTNAINTLKTSVNGIESDIASLQNRWNVCVSAGGCQ